MRIKSKKFSITKGSMETKVLLFDVYHALIKILFCASSNGRNGRLTWNNALPKSEVHPKLGGDAGGGSFKMAFQISNLAKPNSKTNTVVFAMFHAKDSWTNLKTALLWYKHQVNILQEAVWRLVT